MCIPKIIIVFITLHCMLTVCGIQLDEYETASYFIQFSQNLTCDCVFPPNLPELNLKLVCSDVQNNFRFCSGKFGENTEINKQSHISSFG